ncbi:uncharacterized protein LOC123822401 [Phyllostomus hastatus]|uniref:uncharacterized protein LOC123822401 n=1 Tax=Phyllostomus hastatus TaxID=9423 RepID=UPI001E684DF0|nr:uncharacterized protein LOC123822401 [Phyllostomus hastatus]
MKRPVCGARRGRGGGAACRRDRGFLRSEPAGLPAPEKTQPEPREGPDGGGRPSAAVGGHTLGLCASHGRPPPLPRGAHSPPPALARPGEPGLRRVFTLKGQPSAARAARAPRRPASRGKRQATVQREGSPCALRLWGTQPREGRPDGPSWRHVAGAQWLLCWKWPPTGKLIWKWRHWRPDNKAKSSERLGQETVRKLRHRQGTSQKSTHLINGGRGIRTLAI